MADTKNVRVLRAFRLKGKPVAVGEVIAKSSFKNNGEWKNLLHMPRPRVEETSDPVGKPKAAPKAPGA